MNRTLLIFIMIASAMIIMVIGNRSPDQDASYTPWDINVLDNGNTRVFGITLNKTLLQDANQILSSFPVNQFKIDPATQKRYLVAHYNALNFNGLIADIDLEYKLTPDELNEIIKLAEQDATLKLPEKNEMKLLGTVIKAIYYRPSIDYNIDMLLKYFGQPESDERKDDKIEYWNYPSLGLKIILNHEGQDEFCYTPTVITPAPDKK
ncbi:MAG: hypothetical protein OEY43_02925 [Gammaproteobacteria bacterium]|nr:hypothetical protein [Gammaproteobacteria bacterium]